jgi:hypothetical protein
MGCLVLFALTGADARSISQTPGSSSTFAYGPCSLRIAIAKDGSFFDILHNGTYKRSPQTLEHELHQECYNDANPSPVTSVVVEIEKDAPQPRITLLYSLLERNGWPREKIRIEPWSGLKPQGNVTFLMGK